MIFKENKHTSLLYTLGYWAFAIVIGVLLILLEEVDDIEPVFSILAFLYWSLLIFWSARWVFRQIKSVLREKKEKEKIELLHLQSQVNPHFFFNILNNLYGLVEISPKKSQALILKLSDMMRYSIYEGQKASVSLEEEIAYLKNYVELHKMRYHKEIAVTFTTQIQESGKKTMPLLFILLVENAFKHGVEHLRRDAFVTLNISTKDDEIHFEVINNFDEEALKESPEGIGIQNLKRRLEIGYPNRHDLSFSKDDGVFTAKLILK